MTPLYQRFFISFILLLAFASRIVVYAIPVESLAKEIIQKNSSKENKKFESSDKQNTLEEEVKFAELYLDKDLKFEFLENDTANRHSISGNFILAYCHLQVPEQPPE